VSDGAQIDFVRYDGASMSRVVQQVTLSRVGAPGQPGSGGGSSDQTGVAGAVISGDRALAWRADGSLGHMDATDAAQRFKYAGISVGAAGVGAPVTFRKIGLIVANFWTWTQGNVFVAADGQLTQAVPTSGVIQPIGFAINATTIDLKPGLPYIP
jgi:hypothetical protein